MAEDAGEMTELAYEQLPQARRRRLVLRASLRALATTTVLVTLYYVLPLDTKSDAWVVTQLVFGLVAVAGILAWQVRTIIGSGFPGMRALQTLFVAVPFYVLTFAATYVMNTWTSWGLGDRPLSPAGVVLHSVPPLVVFVAAEAAPLWRNYH